MSIEAPGTGHDVARLVRDHQRGVWRYLRVLGCDPSQAEDLTQETFLAVLQRPLEDRGPAATAAYLRTVARNLLISARRRSSRYHLVENVDNVETQWQRWAGFDGGDAAVSALEECLANLGERARRALLLRYRDERTRSQIAEALQISEHGAKNLMQRAKQALRECLERRIG